MTTIDKIKALGSLIKVRLFRNNTPLAVRFQLTNRCTLRCQYCTLWKTQKEDLSTEQIVKIIGDLGTLGTKRISLSGGEPLLRKDIEEIVDACWQNRIYPEMNSNGTLVPQKQKIIEKLDFLKLSLDGPEDIHDSIRGKGSYRQVIAAAEIAYEGGVRFGFACTLTQHNLSGISHVLEMAKQFGTIAAFQPFKKMYKECEDIEHLTPGKNAFQKVIRYLIEEKQKGNKHIRNSERALKHIYHWPEYEQLTCWAGKIFCIIDVNGDVIPCDRMDEPVTAINCLSCGVSEAIKDMPTIKCRGCGFCGALELNYLMNYRFDILASLKPILKK
jgi:MoaA/NifB/PqqE/SkfB family radical SAM enzyme